MTETCDGGKVAREPTCGKRRSENAAPLAAPQRTDSDSLVGELAAAEPPSAPDLARLRSLGVPGAVLDGPDAAAVGMIRARFLPGRRYVPHSDGTASVVAGLVEPDGALLDLLAFDLARPERWGARLALHAVLGGGWLRASDDPLPVHRNALEWLAADGDGVMILREREAWRYLRGLPLLVRSGDVDFARRVRSLRSPPPDDSPIYIDDALPAGAVA